MQDDDAVSEQEPSLGDALIPLGTLAALTGGVDRPLCRSGRDTLLHLPYAVLCSASPVLGVQHGVTGVRTVRTEPARLEEKP